MKEIATTVIKNTPCKYHYSPNKWLTYTKILSWVESLMRGMVPNSTGQCLFSFLFITCNKRIIKALHHWIPSMCRVYFGLILLTRLSCIISQIMDWVGRNIYIKICNYPYMVPLRRWSNHTAVAAATQMNNYVQKSWIKLLCYVFIFIKIPNSAGSLQTWNTDAKRSEGFRFDAPRGSRQAILVLTTLVLRVGHQ